MQSTQSTFRRWHAPQPSQIGNNHLEFLHILGSPTWITVDGIDRTRQRAIVTLLHGNEPSGLKAVHRFLKSGVKPATNLGIFIVSVDAALHPPIMSHRFLPEEEDFNRCFQNEVSTNQEVLAEAIIKTLRDYTPEAIIDAHNTSAHSEPFAVAVSDHQFVQQVSQMFTRRLVVMDISLGTLIEQNLDCPAVTVEFGGFLDPRADQLAWDTIENFINRRHLFDNEISMMQILKHPLRLEIKETSRIHYSASVQDEADITIINTIDQMNFLHVDPGTALGWLGAEHLSALRVMDQQGTDICCHLFAENEGFLINQVPMTLFMATTDPYIATRDCLLYLCPDRR